MDVRKDVIAASSRAGVRTGIGSGGEFFAM